MQLMQVTQEIQRSTFNICTSNTSDTSNLEIQVIQATVDIQVMSYTSNTRNTTDINKIGKMRLAFSTNFASEVMIDISKS